MQPNEHALKCTGHARIDKYDDAGNFIETTEAHNIFLTAGINELWKLFTGQSANTFTNAQAQIGIGDSSTAATAGQTDLQAATNKTYVAMNGSFPTVPSAGAVQFQASFTSGQANYVWNEFVLKHGTSGICFDRGVASLGTKTTGTWTITLTLTIT